MKKKLFIFIFLTLFVFMNNVNASDIICNESPVDSTYSYHRLAHLEDEMDKLKENFSLSLEHFIANYNYEKYIVRLWINTAMDSDYAFYFYNVESTSIATGNAHWFRINSNKSVLYSFTNGNKISFGKYTGGSYYIDYGNYKNTCTVDSLTLFYSNFLVNFPGMTESYLAPVYGAEYTHQSINSSAPTIVDNLMPELSSAGYLTLNLNTAPYLLLSLPDYSIEPFTTKIYVKGQFCFTPVYEYGTQEKSNPSTNGCYVYDDYTALTISISQEDIDNHAVYYVSNYDGTSQSYIRIIPSVFDYTFIYDTTNPTFNFKGSTYNIIPYDSLTTNAKTNTTNGVIPGQSCRLGDLSCTAENDPNVDGFNNILENILDFGGSIWSSVVNFMSLVTKLITVLPPEFQEVILICFTFGLIIGVVKIFLK